ncbi:MAG: iron-containing alcohol dehydrogenase [Gammaproteobacteria bacterium]|nr:iron-containing alcohol dehydrogenase [Gammaproteobacteria bacterium]
MHTDTSTEFSLDRLPNITLAPGALSRVGTVAAALTSAGAHVLLVADPGLRAAGTIAIAEHSLRHAGLTVSVFDQLQSDPKVRTVDTAADVIRSTDATVVVALGGGSALDVGKAAAAIAPAKESAAHYALCAHPFPTTPLKTICVPSTSGTGAEITRTAVFSNADGRKLWFWGAELKPTQVLLDPTITFGLPAPLTAATGIDALVHAIEASTNANANAANTVYCREAIRLVTRHLQTAVQQPNDLTARAGLQLAATLAGIGIDNCGTAIAHTIGHALASLRPIHHGRAVGLGLLATLRWNVADDDGAFAAVADAMGVASSVELPAAFERLLRGVGIKVALAGEGYDLITAEMLAERMTQPENIFGIKSNRRPVQEGDLLTFAKTMLTQA